MTLATTDPQTAESTPFPDPPTFAQTRAAARAIVDAAEDAREITIATVAAVGEGEWNHLSAEEAWALAYLAIHLRDQSKIFAGWAEQIEQGAATLFKRRHGLEGGAG